MVDRKHKGAFGEKIACRYLKESGHVIVARNIHFVCGELDLVVAKNMTLIFVEVKCRTTESFGDIRFQISEAKKQKWIRSTECFLNRHVDLYEEFEEFRFDFIGIQVDNRSKDGRRIKVMHLRNVFR